MANQLLQQAREFTKRLKQKNDISQDDIDKAKTLFHPLLLIRMKQRKNFCNNTNRNWMQ